MSKSKTETAAGKVKHPKVHVEKSFNWDFDKPDGYYKTIDLSVWGSGIQTSFAATQLTKKQAKKLQKGLKKLIKGME